MLCEFLIRQPAGERIPSVVRGTTIIPSPNERLMNVELNELPGIERYIRFFFGSTEKAKAIDK